ncbi:hypothetical protein A2867_04085 [Candidatus Daviesbacteria bacterium RIFCSPHIGHO2_01_FULL_40_11]|uniref:CopG family transcriptional regulator n=1 Tax=Candidatus Daviesbacteria bacterium RIFCSPHIGHO2_01_FULL_40_11 TaxID=1797762 RepID=A0A1F5JHJ4_9BACT|nr:MAG: hypothetical protein A2867_04085 [Candidatus Daviesbacteria bacterium RIFCSPHIGHO2_01_FULL_40_11]OGE62848.1 MAG: hypothetical protein A2964_00680 [Candidatus Daviesbacteria bacterium RIFCSPLOWO2_01_FULL_40_27]
MHTERKEDKTVVGIYLSPELAMALKLQAIVEKRTMSDIGKDAVVNYLSNQTRQSGTLDEVSRLVDKVREEMAQITGKPQASP